MEWPRSFLKPHYIILVAKSHLLFNLVKLAVKPDTAFTFWPPIDKMLQNVSNGNAWVYVDPMPYLNHF